MATRDDSGLGAVAGLPATRLLRLPPLTPAEVAEYRRAAVAGRMDPSWPARAHRGSGGNPLFVREMVRALDAASPLPDALRPRSFRTTPAGRPSSR